MSSGSHTMTHSTHPTCYTFVRHIDSQQPVSSNMLARVLSAAKVVIITIPFYSQVPQASVKPILPVTLSGDFFIRMELRFRISLTQSFGDLNQKILKDMYITEADFIPLNLSTLGVIARKHAKFWMV